MSRLPHSKNLEETLLGFGALQDGPIDTSSVFALCLPPHYNSKVSVPSVLHEFVNSQFTLRENEINNISLPQIHFLSQRTDLLPCQIGLLWTAVANAVCLAHCQK